MNLVTPPASSTIPISNISFAGFAAETGLPAGDANYDYTVMANINNTSHAYSPYAPPVGIGPQLLDVLALQYLYGANQNGLTAGAVQTAGGQSYLFTDNTPSQCIWVGSAVGGITTFDFSGCSGKTIINLNPGSFSSTVASTPAGWLYQGGVDYTGSPGVGTPSDNIAIAYGTTVQRAVGNNAGDVFIANSANDTLIGGTGNDSFTVGAGNVTVYGGGGTDTAIFADPRTDYTITPDGHGGLLVTEVNGPNSNGVATLYDISALQFADQTISTTLPKVTNQAANQTWTTHQSVSYALPANSFTDPQNQTLTLVATQANGSVLPGWLTFNGSSFSGTVPAGATGLSLEVTATDSGGLSMVEYFQVAINSSLVTSLPAALAATAGQATAVTGLQITDSNSASATETVTVVLSDQYGSLSAAAANGGQVSGAGTHSATLSGSLAQVDAALATLTYTGLATTTATTDTITVTSSNSLGDANSQQIAVTDAAPFILNGAILGQGTYGTVLTGPGIWQIVGTSTLSGAGISGTLVPSNGAILQNEGNLTLGSASQGGFIGNNSGTQTVHGSFINGSGATLTLVNGGIDVDTFQNAGQLIFVLDQPSYNEYDDTQSSIVKINSFFSNTGTIIIQTGALIGGDIQFDGGGTSNASAFGSGTTYAEIEFGGSTPFTLTGGTFNTYAYAMVDGGSTVNISGTTTIIHGFYDRGTIDVTAGTLTSDYQIDGPGTIVINSGATVQILNNAPLEQGVPGAPIQFNGGHATLALGTASPIENSVTGFAESDVIDLTGTPATSAAFTGGNLVVSNNGSTVATIPISGILAGTQFSVAVDGAGGSLITLANSVAAALAQPSGSNLIPSVVDSGANVTANLGTLQSLAVAGKLTSITLTDAGIPTLTVSATQLSQDITAIGDISGTYVLSVTGISAPIAAFLAHEDPARSQGAGPITPWMSPASAASPGSTAWSASRRPVWRAERRTPWCWPAPRANTPCRCRPPAR